MVPRGEKHPSWVGFGGEGTTSSVRRGDARDGREDVPNEVTAVDGREGPPLFSPINPLAVAAGELEESLLGTLPGGNEARPRSEGAEARTVSLIRPGRSSSRRHDQGKSDCRLRRRLASVVKEYQNVREELGCGQSARHNMPSDSSGKDHAASDAPGGLQVQAKPKAQQENKEEKENDIIFSELDGKWCEFGRGVRGSGSRAKQRRNGSIEAVPREAPQVLSPDHWKPSGDDGGHPGSTGGSTAAGISTRFDHEILGQDYNEENLRSEHQCRDESIGGGDGLIDGWPCGARGRHHGPEVPSPRVRSHRREIVEQSEALGTGPSGRGHVSHPRAARRHESPSAPRSTVDRETKQLGLKRARSESQPAGREGQRQGRTPVEVARREPVREKNEKGNKTWESVEHIPGSSEWLDGKRPKRVWGPALSQEKGKP